MVRSLCLLTKSYFEQVYRLYTSFYIEATHWGKRKILRIAASAKRCLRDQETTNTLGSPFNAASQVY